MRTFLAQLHRYTGLFTAVFLVIAGLGGAILAFQEEIDALLNPSFYEAVQNGRVLSANELTKKVMAADKRVEVTFLPLLVSSGQTLRASVQPLKEGAEIDYNEIFIDPVTGDIKGRRFWGACCFERQNAIPFIYRLHYSMGLPDAWGQWLMGSVAIIWLIDCFVGLWLTFPRKLPFFIKWRKRWWVHVELGLRRAIFDIHNAFGLWLWLMLLILSLSSVDMNLDQEVFKPLVSMVTKVTNVPRHVGMDKSDPALDWDQAIAIARSGAQSRKWPSDPQWIEWRRSENAYQVGFESYAPNRLDNGQRHELHINAQDGSFVVAKDADTRTAGDAFIDFQFPLHSGRLFGLPGRIIVCITGLVTALLAVTGVWMWVKREIQRRSQLQKIN